MGFFEQRASFSDFHYDLQEDMNSRNEGIFAREFAKGVWDGFTDFTTTLRNQSNFICDFGSMCFGRDFSSLLSQGSPNFGVENAIGLMGRTAGEIAGQGLFVGTAVGPLQLLKAGVQRYFLPKLGQSVKNIVANVAQKEIQIGNMADLLINETQHGRGFFISQYKPKATQVLEAAEKYLGKGYKQIGKSGDGVFRSADGLRQFRMDSNSLMGKHDPWMPHVHWQMFKPENIYKPYANNHIIFFE